VDFRNFEAEAPAESLAACLPCEGNATGNLVPEGSLLDCRTSFRGMIAVESSEGGGSMEELDLASEDSSPPTY
jgi:hypothetical protein